MIRDRLSASLEPQLERLSRHKQLLLVVFILFWLPVIFFSKIAGEVLEKQPLTFDIAILEWFNANSNSFLDSFFLFITNAGGIISSLLITILIMSYFIYKRRFMNVAIVGFGVGGAAIADVILKLLFQRSRPGLWTSLVVETDYSFPSGHAMLSSALFCVIVALTWRTRYRWLVIGLGSVIVGLVGISRLYFGVHYPTDIVAGWAASVAWVTISYVIITRYSRRHFTN